MTKPKRRQAGEGSISEYATKAGSRYLIKYGYNREDGSRAYALKRGYTTRKEAAAALREKLGDVDSGTHVAPNKVTVAEHFEQWLDGLRKEPSTVASYRKNVRLHVAPHLGTLRLEQVTGTRLTKLYRHLEKSGRVDGNGGLSARTVRYVHTIIHAGMAAAVRDGLLKLNPADRADPPSAKSAAPPEMRFWDAEQLRTFLDQCTSDEDELVTAWQLLAMTGMRRGEALALRWGDIDWTESRLSVRRAAVLVKNKGAGQEIVIGPPKSGRPRVIDVDEQTLGKLKTYRATRAQLSLVLARDGAYVLGDLTGKVRHPEHFSRRFRSRLVQVQRKHTDLPEIRLHDLRHTHATILLREGVPVKVVSERLGHASAVITLGVYAHVMPGMQRDAASRFAALIYGATAQ